MRRRIHCIGHTYTHSRVTPGQFLREGEWRERDREGERARESELDQALERAVIGLF
jgi:hypothetical protein